MGLIRSPIVTGCILVFILSGCSNNEPVFNRLDGIPNEAVWAGGLDGGHWIYCKKLSMTRFYCHIYLDNGSEISYGEYCLYDLAKNRESDVERPDYLYFDGDTIHLKDSMNLLPDGMIQYPLINSNSAKEQKYDCGKPVN